MASKSNRKAAVVEMMVTRRKSAQLKRQLREKDRSMTRITQLLRSPTHTRNNKTLSKSNKNSPKSSPKKDNKVTKKVMTQKEVANIMTSPKRAIEVVQKTEFYPNKMKRMVNTRKIILKPPNNLKLIGDTHTINKRKLRLPQKGIKSSMFMKPLLKVPSSHIHSESASSDLSIEDMVKIQDEGLTDEDLLEILTCPSPVWWEDPPDEDDCDDVAVNTKQNIEKARNTTCQEYEKLNINLRKNGLPSNSLRMPVRYDEIKESTEKDDVNRKEATKINDIKIQEIDQICNNLTILTNINLLKESTLKTHQIPNNEFISLSFPEIPMKKCNESFLKKRMKLENIISGCVNSKSNNEIPLNRICNFDLSNIKNNSKNLNIHNNTAKKVKLGLDKSAKLKLTVHNDNEKSGKEECLKLTNNSLIHHNMVENDICLNEGKKLADGSFIYNNIAENDTLDLIESAKLMNDSSLHKSIQQIDSHSNKDKNELLSDESKKSFYNTLTFNTKGEVVKVGKQERNKHLDLIKCDSLIQNIIPKDQNDILKLNLTQSDKIIRDTSIKNVKLGLVSSKTLGCVSLIHKKKPKNGKLDSVPNKNLDSCIYKNNVENIQLTLEESMKLSYNTEVDSVKLGQSEELGHDSLIQNDKIKNIKPGLVKSKKLARDTLTNELNKIIKTQQNLTNSKVFQSTMISDNKDSILVASQSHKMYQQYKSKDMIDKQVAAQPARSVENNKNVSLINESNRIVKLDETTDVIEIREDSKSNVINDKQEVTNRAKSNERDRNSNSESDVSDISLYDVELLKHLENIDIPVQQVDSVNTRIETKTNTTNLCDSQLLPSTSRHIVKPTQSVSSTNLEPRLVNTKNKTGLFDLEDLIKSNVVDREVVKNNEIIDEAKIKENKMTDNSFKQNRNNTVIKDLPSGKVGFVEETVKPGFRFVLNNRKRSIDLQDNAAKLCSDAKDTFVNKRNVECNAAILKLNTNKKKCAIINVESKPNDDYVTLYNIISNDDNNIIRSNTNKIESETNDTNTQNAKLDLIYKQCKRAHIKSHQIPSHVRNKKCNEMKQVCDSGESKPINTSVKYCKRCSSIFDTEHCTYCLQLQIQKRRNVQDDIATST